jgi:hypothetical protein
MNGAFQGAVTASAGPGPKEATCYKIHPTSPYSNPQKNEKYGKVSVTSFLKALPYHIDIHKDYIGLPYYIICRSIYYLYLYYINNIALLP